MANNWVVFFYTEAVKWEGGWVGGVRATINKEKPGRRIYYSLFLNWHLSLSLSLTDFWK